MVNIIIKLKGWITINNKLIVQLIKIYRILVL